MPAALVFQVKGLASRNATSVGKSNLFIRSTNLASLLNGNLLHPSTIKPKILRDIPTLNS